MLTFLRPMAIAACICAALAACSVERVMPPSPALPASGVAALPGWAEDDHASALAAFVASCSALRLEGKYAAALGNDATWQSLCWQARTLPKGDSAAARGFFEQHFEPLPVASAEGGRTGLFTGYYEILLHGSREKSEKYNVPIYRLLPGQVTATRQEIDEGALAGKGLEIAWVDDAVDAFFLHVQGSGRVQLAEGGELALSYAGTNGLQYFSIGKALVEMGELTRDQATAPAIRAWLRAHPERRQELLWRNPRYIFFKERENSNAPVGTMGVGLTPERSLAVDPAHIPLGALVWLSTTLPEEGAPAYRRLMVAQDTGSAIKGAVRGDIFFGAGERAATLAGTMKQEGEITLLVPRRDKADAGQ